MGLCFGGGRIGLGLASAAFCLLVLRGLKPVEKRWIEPDDKRRRDRGGADE